MRLTYFSLRLFRSTFFLPAFLLSIFLNAQTKQDQYITIDPIPDKSCTDSVINVNASSDSGLPVTFEIIQGPAIISGNKIILQKIDFRNGPSSISIVIKASQKGDTLYNEATDVTEKFNIKTTILDSLTSTSFYLSKDTIVTEGDTLKLNAKKITGLDYLWTLPTGDTYTSASVTVNNIHTSLSGIYSLNISTGKCRLFNNSFRITVNEAGPGTDPKPAPGDSSIYVFKIITPNGDQKNDHLSILNIEKYLNHTLSIFDLWGNLVFQSKHYQKDWPSVNITSGEYYYTLEIPSLGKTYSGGILVLKE